MGALEGQVAVITGAGRGLGREHALLFAKEGAKVVVNDLGSGPDGSGADSTAAQLVVDEITALGGEAVANAESVADWESAGRLIKVAIEAFGDLHVLVNNAGILRDRMLVNMTEEEWDAVIAVHLKGTFCPTRHAAGYWRQRAKELGRPVKAAVICTSSTAGMHNNVGQANYGAAKSAIATFAQIAAKELGRYGVRVNAISPGARTRLTLQAPGVGDAMKEPDEPDAFDRFDPANVSPLVAYLATEDCPFTGGVWSVAGGHVGLYEGWHGVGGVNHSRRWTIDELKQQIAHLVADRASRTGMLISEGERFREDA